MALEFVNTVQSADCSEIDSPPELPTYDPITKTPCFETRKSCHSCGNVRKTFHKCPMCPHIFCRNCTKKMTSMYGKAVFSSKSCPVCANLCCCADKSSKCNRRYHCYRKCPVSRADVPRNPQLILSRATSVELPRNSLGQHLFLSCAIDAIKQKDVGDDCGCSPEIVPAPPPEKQ